jgi:septal ring factor EnvC (AmiA/AmiB activator)
VGDSGSLTGPQLYFELREDRVQVDPLPWLKH